MNETVTDTERVLAGMLTENTGSHFLDSGSAYGRAWERNQADAGDDPVAFFKQQPEGRIDKWGCVTINVFHFLAARVDYAAKLDRAWRTWVRTHPAGRWDEGYRYYNGITTAEEFIAQLVRKGWVDPGSDFHGTWVNSYNNEDALSQVIQWTPFFLTEECPWGVGGHVLLSIHGGCDVRGGYTDLRAFDIAYGDPDSMYEGVSDLLDNARVELGCRDCGDYWADSSDAGYSWHDPDGDEVEPPVVDESYESDPKCPKCGSTNLVVQPRPCG